MTHSEWEKYVNSCIDSFMIRGVIPSFKVGDKVRYRNYHNIKGTVTTVDHTGKNILINDTLMATPDEIELDVDMFIDNQPFVPEIPAKTKYKCTCSLRDLMMKGCTRHE